jgi:predicted transcriptional regulator
MRKTDDHIILKMLEEGKSQKEIADHFEVSPAAISKRIKRILPKPETFEKLTSKEQEYVLERVNGATKTNAALAAYDCSSRESAKSIGIELSNKPDIEIAMNEMLQHVGLTRRYRAMKTKQHVDSPDPNVSLKALDQANKIDGSYAPEAHIQVNMSYEELCEERDRLQKELIKSGWIPPNDHTTIINVK